jgi:hypothetical protein
MNKKNKAPEEIAKDLEEVSFDEIEEGDLKELFGSSDLSTVVSNCNCPINES